MHSGRVTSFEVTNVTRKTAVLEVPPLTSGTVLNLGGYCICVVNSIGEAFVRVSGRFIRQFQWRFVVTIHGKNEFGVGPSDIANIVLAGNGTPARTAQGNMMMGARALITPPYGLLARV